MGMSVIGIGLHLLLKGYDGFLVLIESGIGLPEFLPALFCGGVLVSSPLQQDCGCREILPFEGCLSSFAKFRRSSLQLGSRGKGGSRWFCYAAPRRLFNRAGRHVVERLVIGTSRRRQLIHFDKQSAFGFKNIFRQLVRR